MITRSAELYRLISRILASYIELAWGPTMGWYEFVCLNRPNSTHKTYCRRYIPPPPPTPIEPGGTYARFPITRTPYLGKRIYPPISGIGYLWQLQKTSPFPGFLGKSSRDYGQKIPPPPPFPRKWEYARGPLMHSSGVGAVIYLVIVRLCHNPYLNPYPK